MKTILVCNQKGGVGKSLVADEIAFSFERSGIPVSFYDLDTQGGTLHKTHEADGAQVAVVDTPGALQEGLADWLKEADVVVIPTRTTSRDIEPLMRMRKAVFKNGHAKIVYVMNGWNRFKASRDFMEWFEGLAGDQTVAKLPQSEAFVQAGAAGKSVVEFDRRGKAAKATLALVGTVREAAGFPKIPQITNPEEAVQTLGTTAQLTFIDADGKEWLTGSDIKKATYGYGRPTGNEVTDVHYVQVQFTSEGQKKFAEATGNIAARTDGTNIMAIVMDNQVISSPSVSSQIDSDSCVISGSFTRDSASELADLINAGQIPFSLKQVELRSVGPQLGADAMRTSLIAGAIGIVLVMLFMLIRPLNRSDRFQTRSTCSAEPMTMQTTTIAA